MRRRGRPSRASTNPRDASPLKCVSCSRATASSSPSSSWSWQPSGSRRDGDLVRARDQRRGQDRPGGEPGRRSGRARGGPAHVRRDRRSRGPSGPDGGRGARGRGRGCVRGRGRDEWPARRHRSPPGRGGGGRLLPADRVTAAGCGSTRAARLVRSVASTTSPSPSGRDATSAERLGETGHVAAARSGWSTSVPPVSPPDPAQWRTGDGLLAPLARRSRTSSSTTRRMWTSKRSSRPATSVVRVRSSTRSPRGTTPSRSPASSSTSPSPRSVTARACTPTATSTWPAPRRCARRSGRSGSTPHDLGLKVYLRTDMLALTTPLEDVPRRRTTALDAEDPELWDVYAAGLDELYREMPYLDGVLMRIGEAGTRLRPGRLGLLLRPRPSPPSPAVRAMLTALHRPGRAGRQDGRSSGPGASASARSATCTRTPRRTTRCSTGSTPEHLVVSTKYTLGDFYSHLPLNETLETGTQRRIVELQSRREFEAFGALPNDLGDLYRQALQHFLAGEPARRGCVDLDPGRRALACRPDDAGAHRAASGSSTSSTPCSPRGWPATPRPTQPRSPPTGHAAGSRPTPPPSRPSPQAMALSRDAVTAGALHRPVRRASASSRSGSNRRR